MKRGAGSFGSPATGQRGTTLVEVLVAMLLLAVGLLGVASMQLVGLQNATNANLRTQASLLAYDIADRMRANRDNGFRYQIDFGDTVVGFNRGMSGDITDDDLYDWKTALAANLPKGDGAIAFDGIRYTITVRWVEHTRSDVNATDGIQQEQFALVVEL